MRWERGALGPHQGRVGLYGCGMRASGPRSQRLVDPGIPVGEGVFLRGMIALAAPGDAELSCAS